MILVRRARGAAASLGCALGLSTLALAAPGPVAAQDYAIASSTGDSLRFELSELRVMLDTARALYADLEEDPRVLYILGFGPSVSPERPEPAYPWNAVQPQSDSTVNLVMPGNLREADRAYHNYGVMRMREIRTGDPDDPCEALVAREERVLSSFVDGWVLARTLFGGPAFAALDELAFARAAGHLDALLAARGDTAVGACAVQWAGAHPEAIDAYEAWRAGVFPDLEVPPPDTVTPADGAVGAAEPDTDGAAASDTTEGAAAPDTTGMAPGG